ncbi:hypothetical protein [Streptosporangium sp. NPDC020145]
MTPDGIFASVPLDAKNARPFPPGTPVPAIPVAPGRTLHAPDRVSP